MNGGQSDFFIHKKGLRQGDPLSPMLFDLAVDVLQKMIEVLNDSVQEKINRKINTAVIVHQYADDTVFIAKASNTTFVSLKVILRLFTAVSGLAINFDKSSWIPINICQSQIEMITAVLGCSLMDFPINYLGLPLSLKRPTKDLFMPLIEKLELRLAGWKGRLLSRGGRLQLMNSMLSSIPIYFMSSFLLPKWVINRLDKIRRGFLWGKAGNKRGISLINWMEVCLPKHNGGMGVANLMFRNWALLLRWWWRLYRHPDSLWARTTIPIKSLTSRHQHRVWIRQGSFFWMQLLKIKPLFDMGTSWTIGTGSAISYWFDAWTYPLRSAMETPSSTNRSWSLQKAIQQGLHTSALGTETTEDQLVWQWSGNHEYSAKSAYDVLVSGGLTKCQFSFIWKLQIPPTVRVFAFLMLRNKLLTHDVMLSRGLQCELQCELCHNCPMETSVHLFFSCRFARIFWGHFSEILGFRFLIFSGADVQKTVHKSCQMCRRFLTRKQWGVYFFVGCWWLWKCRNRKIFDAISAKPRWAAHSSLQEAQLWFKYC